ncbi:purine permease 21-like [Ziziphus jujuba]|uniref:Probable purine permease n=1 Tax=Ziziphus jujuba TaxID=326968 RepID=A0A6P4AQC6_ZIZJJ|nr:purine permease 21-like [Ziziphus jujuba]
MRSSFRSRTQLALSALSFLDMADIQEPQDHHINVLDLEDNSKASSSSTENSTNFQARNYKWWIRISMYILFVLCGQSTATLLGRLYYDQGGHSKWIATLVQTVGFPILLPFYFISSSSSSSNPTTINGSNNNNQAKPKSILVSLSMVYVTLGLLIATSCFLISYGLMYLQVSTLSIILASQLGFTAFFSFFLNSQKFTPFIVNSIFLLTISSVLIAFQPNSSNLNGVSKAKQAIGFICTLASSALNALILALSQFFFRKVIKKETFKAVLNLILFESIVASFAIVVGLFASSEWNGLGGEMVGFGLGKASYVMTLVWTAITWMLFQIGAVGLIFEISSLFCNVISALALPLTQVLAVIVFHDKMDGVKAMAMVLAIWGSGSYIYQHYIDDYKAKKNNNVAENYGNSSTGVLAS